MSQFPPELEARLLQAIETIGRMGAKNVEFAFMNDDVPVEQADWWAKATFKGSVIFVEHHIGPIQALEALAERLQRGAKCRHCGNRVQWGVVPRATAPKDTCVWDKVNGRWERGCRDQIPEDEKAIPDEVTFTTFTDTDEQQEALTWRGQQDLPPKVKGKHRWTVTVMYALSEDEAKTGATAGGDKVTLDESRRVFMAMGCYDCEGEYYQLMARGQHHCPAEAAD